MAYDADYSGGPLSSAGSYSSTTTVSIFEATPYFGACGPGSVAEGSLYAVYDSFCDPGLDNLFSWAAWWGDGSSTTNISASASSATHSYTEPGSYCVTLVAFDEDHSTGSSTWAAPSGYCTTIVVNVSEAAATVQVVGGGVATVTEGVAYTMHLTFSDPGLDQVNYWHVDWGDTSSSFYAGALTALTHNYASEPGAYNVTVQAYDEDEPSTQAWGANAYTSSVHLTVAEAAQAVSISGPAAAVVNTSVNVIFSLADSGGDVPNWAIDWGDTHNTTAGATASVNLTHGYTAAGSYTITATATDEDGTFTRTFNETVSDTPTAWVNGSTSVVEGSVYSLDGGFCDAAYDQATKWAINWGDQTPLFMTTASSGPFTHIFCEASGSYVISATAYDADGYVTLATSVMVTEGTVAAFAWGDVSAVAESGISNYTLFTSFTDPLEGRGGWYVIWGDDTSTSPCDPAVTTATHAYSEPGVYHPTIMILDVDHPVALGGSCDASYCASATVTVSEVDAFAGLLGSSTIIEGSPYQVVTVFEDRGGDKTTQWKINWGDNTPADTYTDPACNAFGHVYQVASDYTVTATAVYEDGITTVTQLVHVKSLAPLLQIQGATSVVEGADYTLNLFGAFPADDHNVVEDGASLTWHVDWGDGNGAPDIERFDGAVAAKNETHVYTQAGPYAVVATAVDDHGVTWGPVVLNGQLDVRFGSSATPGIVTTDFGGRNDQGRSVALQPSAGGGSNIIAAGISHNSDGTTSLALARYSALGVLDTSFGPVGSGGKVLTTFGGADAGAAVAVQSGGSIFVAGQTATGQFAITRFSSDGIADGSFGGTGVATTHFGGTGGGATAMALQDVGGTTYIVVAGTINGNFALARYTTQGTLDATSSGHAGFGDGSGEVIVDLGGWEMVHGLAIDPSGNIVVSGESANQFALARFTPAGALDTTFGNHTGKVISPLASGSALSGAALAIQSDGSIVVAGTAYSTNSVDFIVARYTSAGVLDPAFGATGPTPGMVTTGSAMGAWANAIALESNASGQTTGIVVAGQSAGQIALARYLVADGRPDPTFGVNGTLLTAAGDDSSAAALLVQPDGKILLAGTAQGNFLLVASSDLALARYEQNNTLTVAPTAPDQLTLVASATDVQLSWANHSPDATAIEVDRSVGGGAFVPITTTLSPAAVSLDDAAVIEGMQYQYEVRGLAGAIPSQFTDAQSVWILPLAPSSLVASISGGGGVDLTWANQSTHASSSTVDRSDDGGFTWAHIQTGFPAGATAYHDATALEGGTYQYRVFASVTGADSAFSPVAIAAVPSTPPGGIGATGVGTTSLTITWTDHSDSEGGFLVERSLDGIEWIDAGIAPAVPGVGGVGSFLDTGLADATTYCYRVSSLAPSGRSPSTNSFSVSTLPLAPTDLTAQLIGSNDIHLEWTGQSTTADGYTIERAANGGAWSTVSTPSRPTTSFDDTNATGLVEATTYQYRISAYKGTGASTTAAFPSVATPPAGPTDLHAAVVAGHRVDLTWSNHSAGAMGLIVQRADADGNWVTIATPDHTVTSYSDTSAPDNATVSHRVSAHGASDSDPSLPANVVTPIAAPIALAATATSDLSIHLSWTIDSASTSAVAIERGDAGGQNWTPLMTLPVSVTAYDDTLPSAGQSWQYRITASDGTTSSATIIPAHPLPSPPTQLAAQQITSTSTLLTWASVSNATGYLVQRSGDGSNFAQVYSGTATNFTDNTVQTGAPYWYRVASQSNGLTSLPSSAVYAASAPATPASLTATAASDSQIDLTWNPSAGATGYHLDRQVQPGVWDVLTDLPAAATSYSDTGLPDGTLVHYQITAFNDAGMSLPLQSGGATTNQTLPDAPTDVNASPLSATSVLLTWTNNAYNESRFRIETSPDGGVNNDWSVLDTTVPGVTSYLVTHLTAGSGQSYEVVAYNSVGATAGDAVFAQTLSAAGNPQIPDVPVVVATPIVSQGTPEVIISWAAPPASDPVSNFSVQRSRDGVTFGQIALVSAQSTSYSDDTAKFGITYDYRVVAIGSNASSAPSNVASGITLPLVVPRGPSFVHVATLAHGHTVTVWWQPELWHAPAAPIDGFHIFVTNPQGVTSSPLTVGPEIEVHTFSGLSNGDYTFTVKAFNSAGDATEFGGHSASVGDELPPSSITPSLSASDEGGGTFSLAWDQPANRVPYVELSLDDSNWYGTAFSDSSTITVPRGFDGYVRIAAVTEYEPTPKLTPYSNAVHISYLSAPVPTIHSAVADSPTGVLLPWSVTGTEPDRYDLQRSSDNGASYQFIDSYMFDSFAQEGTKYLYRVRSSIDNAGPTIYSAWSTPVAVETPPEAPHDLVLNSVSATTIDATWANGSDSAATTTVQLSTDNSFSSVGATFTVPAGTTTFRFTDLYPSQQYYVRLIPELPDHTPSLIPFLQNYTSTLAAPTVSINRINDGNELGPDGKTQDGYFLLRRTGKLTDSLTVTVNLGRSAATTDYSIVDGENGSEFPIPVPGTAEGERKYQITIPADTAAKSIRVKVVYDQAATKDAGDSVVATVLSPSGSSYTVDSRNSSATVAITEEPVLNSLTAAGQANGSPGVTATNDGSVPDLYLPGDDNGWAKVSITAAISPGDLNSRRLTLWTLKSDGQNPQSISQGNFRWQAAAALPATAADHDYLLSAGVDLNGDGHLDSSEITSKIKIHVLKADLDVDSDNNNGTGMPDDSKQEEAVDLTAPGKVLALGATALTPVVVDLPAKGTGTGQWRLRVKFGNSKISIYTDSGGNTAATLAADPDSQGEFTTDLQSLPDKAGPTTFYVKGIVASDSPGDIRLSVEIIKPAVSPGSGGSGSSQMTVDHDDALLTVDAATLIIDSNNALGLNDPLGSYTTAQGGMKDTPGLPGKVIQINDKATKDHIPDFADGSNAIPNRDIPDASAPFTPMDIRLSPGIDVSDPSKIIFQLDYSGSDPAAIITPNPNGDNRQNDPTVYLPAPGMLRIWAKDGTSARHVADIAGNGDYLKPNTTYSWAQLLAQLPAGSKIDDHTVRVYVEGIQTSKLVGDQEIKIRVNPLGGDASPSLGSSGPVLKDALRVTNGFVRVNVDSDNDDGHNVPKVDGVERLIQDDPKLSGKYIALNDGDINNNNIPNFADSNNSDASAAVTSMFQPVVITIPDWVDLANTTLTLEYPALDPANIIKTATGVPTAPYIYDTGVNDNSYLRLWVPSATNHDMAMRDPRSVLVGPPGALSYYAPPQGYTGVDALGRLGFINGKRSITLWLEAVGVSPKIGASRIHVTLDPGIDSQPAGNTSSSSTGTSPGGPIFDDGARVTAVKVDADVDSDNTGAIDDSPFEDEIRDHRNPPGATPPAGLPGKYVPLNTADKDLDGIPDFADGYNRDGLSGTAKQKLDDTTVGEHFVPLQLQIPQPVDLSKARLIISYNTSDPALVTRTGSGTALDPFLYQLPTDSADSGALRLWTKPTNDDDNCSRTSDPFYTAGGNVGNAKVGYYVPPSDAHNGHIYGPGDLAKLGFQTTMVNGGDSYKPVNSTVTLYIEGVRASQALADQEISVYLDPDGTGQFIALDAVRATVVGAELNIDSDNNNPHQAGGSNLPDHSPQERAAQDVPGLPGKVLLVNDADRNLDGVPDFAQGFKGGVGGDQPLAGMQFVPLVVYYPKWANPAVDTVTFNYSASDPLGVTHSDLTLDDKGYNPASGFLRLWKQDGGVLRDPRSANDHGDFIAAGTQYKLSDLGASGGQFTLYVEAVRPSSAVGDQRIVADFTLTPAAMPTGGFTSSGSPSPPSASR